jgi:hypothetical protein
MRIFSGRAERAGLFKSAVFRYDIRMMLIILPGVLKSRRGLCLLPLIFFWSFKAAAEPVGIVPGTDFKRIFNRSTVIDSAVFSTRDTDNSVWITMFADTHVVTDIPLARLRYIITDYENYPRYFKRNTASKVAAVTGDGIYQDVQVTVGLLGITFTGRYTVLVREIVNNPAQFVLEFSHVTDNGAIRNVHGQWYFESVTVNDRPGTYIRYISSSESIRRSILQKTAMALFVGAEFTDMTDQLLKAAADYW